jgi:beta-N-acetylhexosaminidase
LPATLSPRIATDLLRRDLGFGGVAITDAMDMKGVSGEFGEEEAAARALAAGCDLLLYCFEIEKPRRAREGLRAGLESGRISGARLQEAVHRVDRLRALAAAAADRPGAVAPLTPAKSDATWYAELCRRALRVADPTPWAAFAGAVRRTESLIVAGTPADVVERLAACVGQTGTRVRIAALDAMPDSGDEPLLIVVGERRPLAPAMVQTLRALPERHSRIALANVLTPEVDAPIADRYAARLQSADHTDAMLAAVAERILARAI